MEATCRVVNGRSFFQIETTHARDHRDDESSEREEEQERTHEHQDRSGFEVIVHQHGHAVDLELPIGCCQQPDRDDEEHQTDPRIADCDLFALRIGIHQVDQFAARTRTH